MSESRLTPEQEERLALYRANALTAEARAAFEREVVESAALSEELYAELALEPVRSSLESAPVPAVPRQAASPRPARRAWAWAIPLAAALLAVSALGWWLAKPRDRVDSGDVMRGGGMGPRLLEPAGTIPAAPRWLRWNAVPGASQYRVELFDGAGHGLGTAVTADTVYAVDSLAHRSLEAGEWRVVPIDPDGSERPPLARASFRVGVSR